MAKRVLLVYTPDWKNLSKVPSFVVNKAEKILLNSPGRHGWTFTQVGYIPLSLRGSFSRADTNYTFSLKVTDRSGTTLADAKTVCDACTTSEAMERLSELRDTLLDKLEPLFKAGHAKWKKAQEQKSSKS